MAIPSAAVSGGMDAVLRAGASDARGITVTFFDGDPARGGRAFEQEKIPFLPADQVYVVRARWKPADCGSRTVFVEASGEGLLALGDLSLDVACQTLVCGTLDGDAGTRADADWYRFRGERGETVTIRAKPAGPHAGDTMAVTLSGPGLAKRALWRLPSDMRVELPGDGLHGIRVQHPPPARGRFEGGYCLSLESSAGAWETLRAVRLPFDR